MIPYPVMYGMRSTLCPHPDSLRTKTSVEGVGVLQSRTMIHVATIPNHEAVISFGGKQGVNLYATVTRNLFVQIKIFVNMLLLLLSPMNEYSNNPGTGMKTRMRHVI